MRIGTAVGIALLLFATNAMAKHRQMRVRSGDSLSSLAEYFYGAEWKSIYLSTHNDLEDDSLSGVKVLELPRAYVYTARSGDSFASIAAKRLFRADRYPVLLRFNSLRSSDELEVGQELLMPFHLFHIVDEGDSLSKISARYYRTRKLAGALREYNALKSNALEVGQKIVVPIFDKFSVDLDKKPDPPEPVSQAVTKTETPRSADPNEPAKPTKTTAKGQDSATGAPLKSKDEPDLDLSTVRSAIDAYQSGYFRSACSRFESFLEAKVLDAQQRTRVIQYLGFCSVASGDESAARDYFRSWLLTDPEATLDRRLTSPKILSVFDEIAAEVRREPFSPERGD